MKIDNRVRKSRIISPLAVWPSTPQGRPSFFQHPWRPTYTEDAGPEEAESQPQTGLARFEHYFRHHACINYSLHYTSCLQKLRVHTKATKPKRSRITSFQTGLLCFRSEHRFRHPVCINYSLHYTSLLSNVAAPQESCEAEKKQNHMLPEWPRVLFVIQSIVLDITIASTFSST